MSNLNLKGLSKYLEYKLVEMRKLKLVLPLVQTDCYNATFDVKDTYCYVNIDESEAAYLNCLSKLRLLKNFI